MGLSWRVRRGRARRPGAAAATARSEDLEQKKRTICGGGGVHACALRPVMRGPYERRSRPREPCVHYRH
jgi:hypothetical protein